ncbi:hypothetical protein N7481_010574 [Penicillium waksmanii]|uniref:uncharacterized protein n=1 Tax=Penicillium waksmanii TaxID=69791 RepID=UPI002549BAFD|nr:uncharacterized protein N7481_010574 [Penicillium waksmanii]KAJ5973364.1 hypothetical protein N7481_010574 [Penicillium waksmanii]
MPSDPVLGWIWPKDPRPGNPSHWPKRWRFFDVLRNKGPDIYVGAMRPAKSTMTKAKASSRTNWARWEEEELDQNETPFRWARRGAERYDFRRRKYSVPDYGTWSRVEYCDGRKKIEGKWVLGKEERHAIPRRFWDKNGELYPANEWHDAFYGAHEDHKRTERDNGCCGK